MIKKRNKKPTAISFFAGGGGMDAGFNLAGFDVKLAVEIDPSCCDTLRRNLKQTRIVNRDINKLSSGEICEMSGLKAGNIDCIFGGPPCQSFSLAGQRKGLDDERGLLVFRFIELVRELRPKTFVLENVKGMVNWQGGVVLREVENMLSEPLTTGEKYKVQHSVLNAADFGVPQSRERVFIVGSLMKSTYRFPEPTHAAIPTRHDRMRKPHVTVGQALRGLPEADTPSKTALRVSQTIKGRIEKHGY
jgi:DNA (cytosine-5)-methyltransferase 1